MTAFYAFPSEHWPKLRFTNPLERVNKEIGRRADVVGIFPNDPAAVRLAGALLIEQNDEWLVSRRYLSEESMQLVLAGEPSAHAEEVIAELQPAQPRARAREKKLLKTFGFQQPLLQPASTYTTSYDLTPLAAADALRPACRRARLAVVGRRPGRK